MFEEDDEAQVPFTGPVNAPPGYSSGVASASRTGKSHVLPSHDIATRADSGFVGKEDSPSTFGLSPILDLSMSFVLYPYVLSCPVMSNSAPNSAPILPPLISVLGGFWLDFFTGDLFIQGC